MTAKKRFIDVWIVESNTVYREVPFEVAADWIQQGRLVEDDQLRWSGTADWFRLGTTPAFAAYLPRSDPMRAEDQAEALEPVEVEFAWKRRPDDDDDDVDMIPLIDVSLVLLIFFMMTATGAVAASLIREPTAGFGVQLSSDPTMIWIGIDRDKDGNAVYSIGRGENDPATPDDRDIQVEEALLARLDLLLPAAKEAAAAQGKAGVDVNVRAHEELPSGVVRRLTLELEKRRAIVHRKFTGVREQGPP
jgi:hypothetical protein